MLWIVFLRNKFLYDDDKLVSWVMLCMYAAYMDDSYKKELSTTVKSVSHGKFVVLEHTVFYPRGGGQPHDTGKLVADDGRSYNVVFVGKFDKEISHEVDREGLKVGQKVTCVLDWPRRYNLMRAHTASHLISAIFHDDFGAMITGNQLSEDRIRIDFDLEEFDRDLLQSSIDKVNKLLLQDHKVSIQYLPREQALKDPSLVKLAGAVPPSVAKLRIVTIGLSTRPIDRQADGGTHVKSTKEIGTLELLKAENKGKSNRRVYVGLVD